MKELTIIWGRDATEFDKAYARGLFKKFQHAEYIKKKIYPPLELYYVDFETHVYEEV